MKGRLLLLVFFPSLLLFSTIGIHLIEYRVMENEDYRSILDCLYWTVVTISTVGFGDMSPVHTPGRVFTLFVIVGGVVNYSLIISLITSRFAQYHSRRERGLDTAEINGHILICSDDPNWMTEILIQIRDFEDTEKIVLIAPFEEHPLLTTPFKNLIWISGDAYKMEMLQKASAINARIAYVYYRENSNTLMTVMQLETMSGGRIITLSQYIGEEYRKYFEDVGCDHAVDPYELYVPLMMQAFRSQGGPSWIKRIVYRRLGNTLHTRKVEPTLVGLGWMDYVIKLKASRGIMPLAVVIDEVVMINPDSDFELTSDVSVLRLEPPPGRPKGDHDEDAIQLIGMADIPIDGHLIISSDNPIFIKRLLSEMSRTETDEPIKILSEITPFEDLPENLNIEWIHGPSNAEESFRKANASEAKVAFIDHLHDGQNLMAVLRLEQESDGEVFSISTYHEKDFDQQLRRVGCDFCLQVDDLVAPLLSQSAENSGLGTMIEQILSEESSTQSLFVRKLKIDWVPKNWLETISEVKRQCNHLAVGLIRHRESRLLVNPHPETMVYSGDKLIFIALESEENRQILFEPNHILSIADEPFLKGKEKISEPVTSDESADKLFQEAMHLSREPEKVMAVYRLFHQAAIKGHAQAQYNLGIMIFNGQGIPKNREEAYHWFRESVRSGNSKAKRVLRSIRVLREIEVTRENTDSDEFPEFNPQLLENLDEDQRYWFAKTVVAMVMVDEHIEIHERAFLHSALRLLTSQERVQELEEAILLGKIPTITPIRLSEEDSKNILESLINVATIDRDFDKREEKLFQQIGNALDVDDKFIQSTIKLGHTRIQQFRANQLRAPNVRARV